jgi:hypothetical protein
MTPRRADREIIPEGTRNTTMSRYAVKMLKRYGDTERAVTAFHEMAAKCEPPLSSRELSGIWSSAKRFYLSRVSTREDYAPPESYNSAKTGLPLPVVDAKALDTLDAVDQRDRKFCVTTARLFLRAFGVSLRMNDMNRRVEVGGLPPAYSGENASSLLDTLVADAASALGYRRAGGSIVYDTLAVIAAENHYHPVIELLEKEPWDGIDRINDIYAMLGLSDEFHKTLLLKWCVQCVALLRNSERDPLSAQGVLTLQGPQGIGKTEFFRHLAIRDQFFKGGATLDVNNKDSIMSSTMVWICELGELDATTKKEQSALKAFLTEATDRFREPYARSETVRPRRASFCGTVNPTAFLRDETGNRRYWTIPVSRIDRAAIFEHTQEWYAQFWRQICSIHSYDPKAYLLTRDEQAKVNGRNADFEAGLYGEDEFLTAFDVDAPQEKWTWRSASQIARELNERFTGLRVRAESVGSRLLPRVEARTGRQVESRRVHGRRLMLCPPTLPYSESFSLTPEEARP